MYSKTGDSWTVQISQNDDPAKYCPYGAGSFSMVINSTVSLSCSGILSFTAFVCFFPSLFYFFKYSFTFSALLFTTPPLIA
jgi:hypothetical protein